MTIAILCVFVLGYLAIALEHKLMVNKAASAIRLGVICWSLYILDVNQLMPVTAIGSAAGVAAMGLEHIDFLWYLRKITPWAIIGYLSGAGIILIQRMLLS